MEGNCCTGQCASLNVSFLSELSGADRCDVKNYSLTLYLKKGQNIFEQGKESEGFFCIKKGKIKTGLESSNGDSITLGLYADKGILGHLCLIEKKNFYTATCLTDAEVCFLPRTVIARYLPSYPAIEARIKNAISEQYSQLTSLVLSLRSKSVQQRTAETLIKLQNVFGKDADNCIDFEMTKEEISNLTGSSVESVFRTLSLFRQKNYISFVKRKIQICNEGKLRSLGKIYAT